MVSIQPDNGNPVFHEIQLRSKTENQLGAGTPVPTSLPSLSTQEITSQTRTISMSSTVNQAVLEEVGRLLQQQANEIEKEIEQLEHSKSKQEIVESIIETEEWAGWFVSSVDSVNESVVTGVEFLKEVLPKDLLTDSTLGLAPKKIQSLITLGGAFLTALESGLEGFSLFLKTRILRKSHEVLDELKHERQNLGLTKPLMESTTKPDSLSTSKLHPRLNKSLQEWEIDLLLEQEAVREEMLKYRVDTASNALTLISIPLTYLPKEAMFEMAKVGSSVVSWILSGLELISLGLEVKKNAKTSSEFNQWKQSFLKWQEQFLATNTNQKIESLMDKREEICEKKTKALLSRFDEIKGGIHDLKEKTYIRSMQDILWNHLAKPSVSPLEVKKALAKWGFGSAQASPKTHAVAQALDRWMVAYLSPSGRSSEKERASFIQAFHDWMTEESAMNDQFEIWFQKESIENRNGLLAFYVDHQETIEQTVKNALKEMVQKKHSIEQKFIKFDLRKSQSHLLAAGIIAIVSVTLAILALVALPVPGASIILLSLSIGSLMLSLGFLGAGRVLAYHEKPNETRFLSLNYKAKLTWAMLRASISRYSHQSKEKKLLEVAKILHQLHVSINSGKGESQGYPEALKKYQKAKLEFEESQKRVKDWEQKVKRMEDALKEKSWQDFAKQAALQISRDPTEFDTLSAFQEAIQKCDLTLLSQETKELLTVHLGLNFKKLQSQIARDPAAIREDLQDFFTLDVKGLMNFIKKQNKKMQMTVK